MRPRTRSRMAGDVWLVGCYNIPYHILSIFAPCAREKNRLRRLNGKYETRVVLALR